MAAARGLVQIRGARSYNTASDRTAKIYLAIKWRRTCLAIEMAAKLPLSRETVGWLTTLSQAACPQPASPC